jgi:hypothetical protein
MIGHGAKFGRKKEAAIAALLTQRTSEDAARSIGIAPATLRRWQKEPEFDAAFRAAKVTACRQTIARMHQLSGAAVSTLGKVMLDAATPPATKVCGQYLESHRQGDRDRRNRCPPERTGGGSRGEQRREAEMTRLQRRLKRLEGMLTDPRASCRTGRSGSNTGTGSITFT